MQDEALAELVECIGVLNEAARTGASVEEQGAGATGHSAGASVSGPVVFLQRVRVLELLASRMGIERLDWTDLMEEYLMGAWIREQVLERLFTVAERATAYDELNRHDESLNHLRGEQLAEYMPAAARDALDAMERMASTGFNYGRLTRKGILWYFPTPKLGLFYLDDGRTLIVVDVVDARRLRRLP